MSVIRRKHTSHFTTIGNVLFEDKRLAADELGVLAFLLSRPNDWEVRRSMLANRFNIGKTSIKRIVLNLISFGWIVAEKTRLANGTYYTVYEVRDEAGPTLTIEQAKIATSSVSEEGEDALSTGDGRPTADPPDTGQRGLASQVSQTSPGPIRDSLNTESIKTDSTKGCGYGGVKAKWPLGHILSDVAAQSAFLGLSDKAKVDAFDGAETYLKDCRDQTRKVCDLTTYLRERRWERFSKKDKKPSLVVVKFGTPQYFRWRDFKIGNREWSDRTESVAKTYGGIAVPSEWPPADISKSG